MKKYVAILAMALLALTSLSPIACAEKWELVIKYPDGDTYYIDQSSIKADTSSYLPSDDRTAWVKMLPNPKRYTKNKEILFELSYYHIDCGRRFLKSSYFATYGLNGYPLQSGSSPYAPRMGDPIIPGTVGDALAKFVCSQ